MFGFARECLPARPCCLSPAWKIRRGRNQITGSENRRSDSAADFVFGNKQTQLNRALKKRKGKKKKQRGKKKETPADNKAMFLRERSRFFFRAAGDSLNYHRRGSEARPGLRLFAPMRNTRTRDIRPHLATWRWGVRLNVPTIMHVCMIKTQRQVVLPQECYKRY